MACAVEGGVGGFGYWLCSFSHRPRVCSKGGYLAKIPTYGKYLSHNVYYGGNISSYTTAKLLILLRTQWLCVPMVVYPIIYALANDYQSQPQARACTV